MVSPFSKETKLDALLFTALCIKLVDIAGLNEGFFTCDVLLILKSPFVTVVDFASNDCTTDRR